MPGSLHNEVANSLDSVIRWSLMGSMLWMEVGKLGPS